MYGVHFLLHVSEYVRIFQNLAATGNLLHRRVEKLELTLRVVLDFVQQLGLIHDDRLEVADQFF